MTNFRSFRNGDSPALAALWNRGIPEQGAARPLTGHEFDSHVISKSNFDANGLIVAERDHRVIGFAHAGFGPDEPVGPPNRLNFDIGTIAMLVVESGPEDVELETNLVLAAERYLRSHGAKVIYAGGQFPLNPFYWGIYGGSEYAGILSTHHGFLRAILRAGYEPVSETVLMEADLHRPEVREPRSPLIRRVARVEVVEDSLPGNWWEALAIGNYRPTCFQLLAKADDRVLARATTWDMSWFGRRDNRLRLGLIGMGVDPEHRRKGYGRHLVAEILRRSRGEMISSVALQTRATNTPALELYQSLGFDPSETSILYRLPGPLTARSDS
ncbi:GNAT family N-acetyltransferase [Singulisphaera acidiphila]|uniref:Acetyltransferase n=1 Tax=Singulisphaera acidiphila (strain ATCC BAA-1392 / DSM 18658 / VKM B-2454 / MOB10) TaxID=886293 RepID=L0D989_SINAD|nr:GNAT family N-acetyltransferase [Singulisphaera acidiphila]AGA25954.1 acetyltransferase [Singulisphaera acidiphila DSM 18658]